MSNLLAEFPQRAEAVMLAAFGGKHHWPKMTYHEFPQYWECNPYGDLATFDDDKLTKLVVAAHEQCVRVSVGPSGPGRVKIVIHNRKGREGRMHERHPTMDQVLSR